LGLIAWIGALVRTARLRRWGWFTCLLIFSGAALTLYIFAGPTVSPAPPLSAVPYQGFGD
jgi:hypothetical protein